MNTRGYAHRMDVEADAATVWSALTTNAHLERWLSPGARLEPQRYGSFSASLAPGLRREALVDLFEPGRRLRLTYLAPANLPAHDDVIVDDFLLDDGKSGGQTKGSVQRPTPEGKKTIVRLLGSGIPDTIEWDGYYKQLRSAQERALARLKVLCEQLQRGGPTPRAAVKEKP